MAAGILDLKVDQGATYTAILFFQDAQITPAPLDLTGSTFKGQIKRAVTDDLPIASFKFTLLDQTTKTGKVQMFLTAADTTAISLKQDGNFSTAVAKYVYDIVRVFPDTSVQRVLQGFVTVSPEVTR